MATSLIPHRGTLTSSRESKIKKSPFLRPSQRRRKAVGGGVACLCDSSERLFCETRGRCFNLQSCPFSQCCWGLKVRPRLHRGAAARS